MSTTLAQPLRKRTSLVPENPSDFSETQRAAELAKYTVAADGCWNYTGYRHANGYGYTGGHVYAHRYFYTHMVGPVPDGLVIDHLCMNKSCVNPAHLEAVTQAENMRRAHAAYGPSERCRNGHDRTEAGTMPNGRCRRCNREKTQRYRASLQERNAPQ